MISALKRKPSLPASLTGGSSSSRQQQQQQQQDEQHSTLSSSLSSKLKSSLALFGSHLSVQDSNTRRFANDEAFERYHYRKQSLSNMTLDLKREPRPGRRPSEGSSAASKGILVHSSSSSTAPSKRAGHHRHTHSLFQQPTQNAPSPGRRTHRRSKTAITSTMMHPPIAAHSSGELTAKEFADKAGIRILPNDELLLVPSTCSPPPPSSSPLSSHIDTSSSIGAPPQENETAAASRGAQPPCTCSCNCSSAISISSTEEPVTPTALSGAAAQQQGSKPPHIWDDAFWRDPRKDHHEPPPIVHEMRTHNSIVIKRGRFEIHLEPSSTHVP